MDQNIFPSYNIGPYHEFTSLKEEFKFAKHFIEKVNKASSFISGFRPIRGSFL